MTYQEKLKGLREDADLSQTDISKILHVAQTAYSKYERGTCTVPIESILRLAKYYHISLDWLFSTELHDISLETLANTALNKQNTTVM